MKIAVVRNRFSVPTWPGITLIEPDAVGVDCDYLVYCGPDIELNYHPDTLVRFRETEFLGVVVESESVHTARPDHPSLLGYPKFRDDFFVLRSEERATEFLKRWLVNYDVTDAVWSMGFKPAEYHSSILLVHVPLDARPEIKWGVA